MTNKVITISRQFGSGGRSIGKKVAEKLGIPYYDKELVDQVAKESGFSHEFIEEIGEYASVTSSFLFNIAVSAHPMGLIDTMSVSDKLLLRKRAIIETVNDELKNIAQVEHSRHRSFDNFVVNLLGGIAAYCYFPKKPTIRVQTMDISNDRQLTLF